MRHDFPGIAALAVQPLLRGLSAHGVDVDAFLRDAGIDPEIARDLEARIPLALLDPLWQRGAELLADPDLGLHAAESVGAGTFGILSYLGVTSATWREGLGRVCKYFRVLSDASEYRLELDGDRARVVAWHGFPATGPVRQRVEFTVAVLACYGRGFVDGPWQVDAVSFEHPPPAEQGEHLRVFGCAPSFGAAWSGFTFPAALLDCALRTGDPELSRILERQVVHMLTSDAREPTVAGALRALLLRSDLDGALSLAGAARRLGMSARTLQRRLHAEGTSHAAVLDEVRCSIAKQMLARGDLAVSEVTAALGFSEPAAFHHAFRRWTGVTPLEFRRALERDPLTSPRTTSSRRSR